jgi:hypothetical protein
VTTGRCATSAPRRTFSSVMPRLLLPLSTAALLAAAAPAHAGWSAAAAQTHAGTAAAAHAAGGSGDRVALGWSRRLGGETRAELRLGRARSGFAGAPLVLDRSTHALEAPLPQYVRGGAFAAAWRRYASPSQRIELNTIDRDGHAGGTDQLTGPSQSAGFPLWVPGPVPSLLWSRDTRADAVELATTGLRGVQLPATPKSEPAGASDAAGLAAVSWVHDGSVLVADRTPGGFGPPIIVATGEVSSTQLVRVHGATLVFWRQDADLMVAARPPGGTFGAPRVVLAQTSDEATAVVTGTEEVLVTDLVGDSSRTGQVQLARLGADGAALGPVTVLGRGRAVQLTADGTGSAFVAWMSERSTRAISVRRVAAGGIFGDIHVLTSREDPTSRPTLASTKEGGAVVAWVRGGDVQATTYRP